MYDTPEAQAAELKRLARAAKFGKLSDAENLLLEKVPAGDFAICSGLNGKGDDPTYADNWGKERQVRAGLMGWLCMDQEARKRVHWRGIQVYGADITGLLDLGFVSMPFRLSFQHCRITGKVYLTRADVSELDLDGSLIRVMMADGISVKHGVFLTDGFTANGELRLSGAQIGGDLNCSGGIFRNELGDALHADGINVKGSVFLDDGFTAKGLVRLLAAQIGGQLGCSGGSFASQQAMHSSPTEST